MKFSVLIPTYLERERIFNLLNTILTDNFSKNIERIVVVTPDWPLTLPKSEKILIVKEKKRKGKSYAIRLGLKHVNTPLVVLLTSDIKMEKNFLHFLIRHFNNSNVGAVIGRPLADKTGKMYKFAEIIWDLHHLLCLRQPKGTEIMAFRKIFKSFPLVSADEVFIEYKIRRAGYRIIYEPRAYGYTKVPNTLLQLFRQRKRSFNGHLEIKERFKYITCSMDCGLLIETVVEYLKRKHSIVTLFYLLILGYIEILARICALVDSIRKKYEIIWNRF